ncbi:MAG: helicase-related protein [Gammaproteobacteria bacterium]|nr:helicase-related protein [Gammaproteobacteria bacterium]
MAVQIKPSDNLAALVRDARSRMGLTQAQFAERLSVTPLTIHRWESGQSHPRRLALERLQQLEEASATSSGKAPPLATMSPISAPATALDFAGEPQAAMLVCEAHRLAYGHQFNPAFASETARIDPLPHQRIAVYERMLLQEPLRFLLADDAGAGKTIMSGLYIREMLSRRRIRRVLIVPPAGLVGNWERELRTLFRLQCRIVEGADARRGNPFAGPQGDRVIVSLDTLSAGNLFAALAKEDVEPYDLVVFDEAHKLSVNVSQRRIDKTRRYQLAEALAGAAPAETPFKGLKWAARHLLLLTATPHQGRDAPYHYLWRLLDAQVFGAAEAFRRYPPEARQRHFIRRTKEEMVDLEGQPLYKKRVCATFSYDLTQGEHGEQALYDRTTAYLRRHYNRALNNRPAVQLAMSVFQRRLASSTWALLRSFERRIRKLEGHIEELKSGTLDAGTMLNRQRSLDRQHRADYLDLNSADDDTGEGAQDYEEAVLGAVAAVTVEELRGEIEVLQGLRDRARRLIDAGAESKFEKLREVLEDPQYAKDGDSAFATRAEAEKWLIFSEHRDTVDFLVRRIEGLGYTDQVATIHGGMAWPEREQEVERFRSPEGARFLVATDAAGEGINLQFCRLMVNYDIPWNPARLEQRMGRIHRYKQKHDVRIINLVAGATHEGRVLKVLLDKLDTIRQALSSDKVFDVIGQLMENKSLREYMMEALTDDGERRVVERINRQVTESGVSGISERDARVYGSGGDVTPRLDGLRRELDRERYLHLLPAYVRRFVEGAADQLGIEIQGDLDGLFTLVPAKEGALDPLLSALEQYPAPVRERLSIRRPEAEAACVWLHPGEAVFDALCSHVIDAFSHEAARGAIFIDPRADAPYLCHLASVSVDQRMTAEEPADATALERRLLAVRQDEDAVAEQPVDALLLLHGAPQSAPGAVPLATRALGLRAQALEFIKQRPLNDLVEQQRQACSAELPERRKRINVNFDLQSAELAKRRSILAHSGEADAEALAALKDDQKAISSERQQALAELDRTPNEILAGPVRFLAHALVIPLSDGGEQERQEPRVEELAVRIASQAEAERNATVQDVSRPALARQAGLPDYPGFDLLSTRASGEVRNIEVKGRAGRTSVQMEANEWKQACHLGKRYWLYVVFDCATSKPRLYRVRDPFKNLLAAERSSSTFSLPVGAIVSAAEIDK